MRRTGYDKSRNKLALSPAGQPGVQEVPVMKKLRQLSVFQKAILLLMIVLLTVFAFIYAKTIRREGFLYRNEIFVPKEEGGGTVYSGKLEKEAAAFTVTPDGTVRFQAGSRSYGPYTVKEDPSAVPQSSELKERMRGAEIREKDTLLFRGGILKVAGEYLLFNEDGSRFVWTLVSSGSGTVLDEKGNVIDPLKPSPSVIYALSAGPALTHKGSWGSWFAALGFCVIGAVSILFADEIFRWQLSFRIRGAQEAEPSDWEMAGRSLTWILMPVLALIICLLGLR